MLPCSAFLDVVHVPMSDAVCESNDAVCPVIYADSSNIISRQFSKTNRATNSTDPIFLCAVPHVVGLRTDQQMVRIDTSWRVASMKNLHFGWNGTVRQNPRDAMGIQIATETWPLRAIEILKSTVAFIVDAGLPQPTGMCFQNLRPKTLLPDTLSISHVAIASSDPDLIRGA